mgnify:CR=1 FL=1
MSNYPLKVNKINWRSLEPQNNTCFNEDNIEGKISDERFAKMSESYETEQKMLECRVTELRSMIATQQESSVNVDLFLAKVRKCTDIRELTPEIIREFVERIEIFKPEQINGHKVQKMRIVWNCIGEVVLPHKEKSLSSTGFGSAFFVRFFLAPILSLFTSFS